MLIDTIGTSWIPPNAALFLALKGGGSKKTGLPLLLVKLEGEPGEHTHKGFVPIVGGSAASLGRDTEGTYRTQNQVKN